MTVGPLNLLGLLSVYAAGGLWLFFEVQYDAPKAPVFESYDPVLPVIKPAPFRNPTLDDFADIIKRPLFDPSRKPPMVESALAAASPTTAEVPEAPSEITEMRLSAIVEIAGSQRALFSMQDGKTVSASKGDRIAGWRLIAMDNEQVTLERHGQRQILKLRDFQSPLIKEAAPKLRRLSARNSRPFTDRQQPRMRAPLRNGSHTSPSETASAGGREGGHQ